MAGIQVAINGAAGRMGKAITEALCQRADMTIAHAYDRPDSPDIGQRISDRQRPPQTTIEASDKMSEGYFDVLIDFSTPDSVMAAAQCCKKNQQAMVIGVTGFSDEQKQQLQMLAKEIPILMAPNMSVGVNLCFALLKQITQTFWGRNAEVKIKETHHKNKKDAPSGTALKMGEIIAKEKDVDLDNIPIESVRKDEIMGIHAARFSTNREYIEIRHKAMDRSPFANGAVHAAWWLVSTHQKPGKLYTMEDAIRNSDFGAVNPYT